MWQNERLQLTNYKHVGYDNNYKINLAIFFWDKWIDMYWIQFITQAIRQSM
jgi:hypothetical protein